MTGPELARLILSSAERMTVDLLSTLDLTDDQFAGLKALAEEEK